MNITIDEQLANDIYDLLVKYCGAHDDADTYSRQSFVNTVIRPGWVEFRFCGDLGFGGKIWHNSNKLYVTAYSEDETPIRLAAIEHVNRKLALLYKQAVVTSENYGGEY